MSITIDKEFKSLIPPLTEEEYTQLEENCIKDGIRDPLVIWTQSDGNSVLVDGHNRWNISAKHGGMPFQTVEMKFADREEAKAWIIENQFGRRNISMYDRSVLALKLKPLIAERAKKRQATHTDQGYQKSDKAEHTVKELAAIAKVSHDTIHKVETIENSGDELLKQKVRSGDITINKAYQIAKGVPENKTPAQSTREFIDEAKQEHEEFQERKTDSVVSFSDIQKDKHNQRIIATELWLRLMKMGERIERIEIEQDHGDIKLSEISDALPETDIKKLENYIHRLRGTLNRILLEVIGE